MSEDTDETEDMTQAETERLAEVHKRAMRRFDECAVPTMENRQHSLAARRFISIPGAQWEGAWGEQFENSIKVEVNKTGRGVEKIERDYRENRIVPDFRPDGKQADPKTAETLDGLHRADNYRFKSQQARDNAIFEGIAGGFGAWRVCNEWDDEYDPNNDHQRVNPASIITDADQSVFFDINARLYDKADARYAFIRIAMSREAFDEEYEGAPAEFPQGVMWKTQDWFTPDTVAVAEYYEKEEVKDTLWILTNKLSGEEKRIWAGDFEDGELAQFKADGWKASKQRRERCRVRKYILSGAEVLEDKGYIAGKRIPIVPYYGKRYFVDGIERWKGYVQDKMDPARLYNSSVSKIAETNSLAPREVPIFAPEQMDPVIAAQWARANIDRLPFLLAHPLRNADGSIAAAGPIGQVTPPQMSQAQAMMLQIANGDLTEDMVDGSDAVKANTSAEAMDIAATRVDAKSGIYLDNARQSVQCEGEIYLGMAEEVYTEEGREVEQMSEEGDHGTATLKQSYTDPKTGDNLTINDFTTGKYKVIASVTEATATRRDKTVKSMLGLAELAATAGDTEMSQAALITAALNTEGEGTSDFTDWLRQRALGMGLVQPSEDEKRAMEEAANAEPQPDPMAKLADAQAQDFAASAAEKISRIPLNEAKTAETMAKAHQAAVQKLMPQPLQPRPLQMIRGGR